MAFSFLAAIGVPSAGLCLKILAPVAGLIFLRWVLRHTDKAIHHLFPSWEWQRQMGWFNIRAHQRATATMRWLGYVVYAALVVALFGVVWGAEGVSRIAGWSDPVMIFYLERRLVILVLSLCALVLYFGWELVPRLRREYEREELERYRAETAPPEDEAEESSRRFTPQFGSRQALRRRKR